jgi:hypothetical protein
VTGRLGIEGDARRAFDVVAAGGIALLPDGTGCAMRGASMDPLRRIHDARKRGSHKRNAMAADRETQRGTLERALGQTVATGKADARTTIARELATWKKPIGERKRVVEG